MKTLTIRGLDKTTTDAIKKCAKKTNLSINKWSLSQIKKAAGIDKKEAFVIYHDLDSLSGTWTEDEYNEFIRNTEQFDKPDSEMWK